MAMAKWGDFGYSPSLRHCSNKYKLAREGEKDNEKDYI